MGEGEGEGESGPQSGRVSPALWGKCPKDKGGIPPVQPTECPILPSPSMGEGQGEGESGRKSGRVAPALRGKCPKDKGGIPHVIPAPDPRHSRARGNQESINHTVPEPRT